MHNNSITATRRKFGTKCCIKLWCSTSNCERFISILLLVNKTWNCFNQGTSLLCTPPQGFGTISTDCSQPSVPGTIASYACRNSRGEVLGGFLNCTNEGYWISSMSSGNNSLCNLGKNRIVIYFKTNRYEFWTFVDAAIINIQSPDVAVSYAIFQYIDF